MAGCLSSPIYEPRLRRLPRPASHTPAARWNMASAAASEPAAASSAGPDAPKETLFAEIQDKLRDECHRVSQQLPRLAAHRSLRLAARP